MFREDSQKIIEFENRVGLLFQLYNGLFTALPFHRIERTGILLSVLLSDVEEGFAAGKSPQTIIESFFSRQTALLNEKEKNDLLFRFIQYAERQVVLFDALEDAAFTAVNDMSGAGTLNELFNRIRSEGKEKELKDKLQRFSIQPVLTAHPTQFYPGPVLAIINDISKAVKENNVADINLYLQQLGKTAFFKKQKPTPYDEAMSLIWYLENVFYSAAGNIIDELQNNFPEAVDENNPVIKMGFWPGGDRDGNPFVTADTTLRVAQALRSAVLKCYYENVRVLRRRITFSGTEILLSELERMLYGAVFHTNESPGFSKEVMLVILKAVLKLLYKNHDGLFAGMVKDMINKVNVFGFHFATLDIRQESSIHSEALKKISYEPAVLPTNYASLSIPEKIKVLGKISSPAVAKYNGIIKDTLQTVHAIKKIQEDNGEDGCNRYIISQCRSALHVMEVYGLFLLGGWQKKELTVDILPLFETVEDLQNSAAIMEELYMLEPYRGHLEFRGNKQTIMLGFSDGTKDGGYLMANWAIYKAKEALTAISASHGIEVIFFDGRGGPPSRGGGKTHRFYSSMGKNICNKEIQVTIQGQTVTSSFGTVDAAGFNMEQLLSAGISNDIFPGELKIFTPAQEALLSQLAADSLQKYTALKVSPGFMKYLIDVSPLQYYSDTNIGSRPAKRGTGKMTLADLRAIPYVGAWSQLKQNVTGYYGVGTALDLLAGQGKMESVSELFRQSLFFKTLLENCEMAMKKTWFPLTAHLEGHPLYGEIWQLIRDEFVLTKKYLLLITGRKELMENYPADRLSIGMRERIVLPLSTIQQYAISKISGKEGLTEDMKEVYKKLIVRSSFGIINAARNAV